MIYQLNAVIINSKLLNYHTVKKGIPLDLEIYILHLVGIDMFRCWSWALVNDG